MKQPFAKAHLLAIVFSLGSLFFQVQAGDAPELSSTLATLYEQVCTLAHTALDKHLYVPVDNAAGLKDVFQEIMSDEQLSDAFRDAACNCFTALIQEKSQLPVHDLLRVMPALLDIAQMYEVTKAERPSSADTNSAISGCAAACDANQLMRLLISIRTILIECCEDIRIDFQETWTILATLDPDVTGIFTVLADIKLTLTECCGEIERDFQGVFTSLIDIKSTLTSCCEEIQRDFQAVFTALVDVRSTLTSCCAEIDRDFSAVFTVLANFRATATVDLSGVFTVLADIKTTLTICCDRLDSDNCKPVYIKQSDFGPSGLITYTINQPGVYKFAENIQYNDTAAAIEIRTSNVILDLQCFSLNGNVNAQYGIHIIPTAALNDIQIRNGMITQFIRGISVSDASGDLITQLVQRLTIESVSIVGCAQVGIDLRGGASSSAAIQQGLIKNVLVNQCGASTVIGTATYALFMRNCSDVIVNQCVMNQNGDSSLADRLYVLSLVNSTGCFVSGCQLNNNTARLDLRVFHLSNSFLCTIQQCTAQDNRCDGRARGCFLENDSRTNKIDTTLIAGLQGFGDVDAFLTATTCDQNIFVYAQAADIQAADAAPNTALARGFNFIENRYNSCIDCITERIRVQNTSLASVFVAAGFDLNATMSNSLLRCIALDSTPNLLQTATRSAGIIVRNGNNNDVQDSYATRNTVGIHLTPDGALTTPVHTFLRNRSVGNFVTQYEGFAPTSRGTAATVNNVNAISFPWTNIGVGSQTP